MISPFDGQGTQSAGAVALRIGAPIEPEPRKGSVTMGRCGSTRLMPLPDSDKPPLLPRQEMNALAFGFGDRSSRLHGREGGDYKQDHSRPGERREGSDDCDCPPPPNSALRVLSIDSCRIESPLHAPAAVVRFQMGKPLAAIYGPSALIVRRDDFHHARHAFSLLARSATTSRPG